MYKKESIAAYLDFHHGAAWAQAFSASPVKLFGLGSLAAGPKRV